MSYSSRGKSVDNPIKIYSSNSTNNLPSRNYKSLSGLTLIRILVLALLCILVFSSLSGKTKDISTYSFIKTLGDIEEYSIPVDWISDIRVKETGIDIIDSITNFIVSGFRGTIAISVGLINVIYFGMNLFMVLFSQGSLKGAYCLQSPLNALNSTITQF